MTNCGTGGAGTESCCTSLEVTGGTYYRTYDTTPADESIFAADGGPTALADPATLSTFRLDKYLVTVGRYRQFVSAVLPADGGAGWSPVAGSGKHTHLNGGLGLADVGSDAGTAYELGWVASDDSNIAPTDANLACEPPYDAWTNTAGGQENLPINCVNWYEAYAFCIWDGAFLPSAAEWGYATAGGIEQRPFPWGSTEPGTNSEYAIYGNDYPTGTNDSVGGGNIAPVGYAALGAGRWGQLDLVGELFAWNLDWWNDNGLGLNEYVNPCVDCAYLTLTCVDGRHGNGPCVRIGQGNNFTSYAPLVLLPFARTFSLLPVMRRSDTGFRCARTP